MRKIWVYAEKERILEKKEGKNEFGRKKELIVKVDLVCLYLYLGYFEPIFTLFFILLFYKK